MKLPGRRDVEESMNEWKERALKSRATGVKVMMNIGIQVRFQKSSLYVNGDIHTLILLQKQSEKAKPRTNVFFGNELLNRNRTAGQQHA